MLMSYYSYILFIHKKKKKKVNMMLKFYALNMNVMCPHTFNIPLDRIGVRYDTLAIGNVGSIKRIFFNISA